LLFSSYFLRSDLDQKQFIFFCLVQSGSRGVPGYGS
jgi:hypothetical protein